jgi:hypothetical protein
MTAGSWAPAVCPIGVTLPKVLRARAGAVHCGGRGGSMPAGAQAFQPASQARPVPQSPSACTA